jgi:hypothetical protein
MKLKHSVAELQKEHVVMGLEWIDRMYLNAYVPKLTSEAGVAGFVRRYLAAFPGSTTAAPAERSCQGRTDHGSP